MIARRVHHSTTTLLSLALAVALAAIVGSPAAAVPRDGASAAAAVGAYLAANPGGVQINETEIAYGGGAFVVTVVPPAGAPVGSLAVADCPAGWFCFYDRTNFNYPRGKLRDCGWQDLGWWGWRDRIESVHYALGSGSAVFINEAGATDAVVFTASVSRRTIADVNPHRNRADYVFRYC